MNVVLTREAGKNDELRTWLPNDFTVNDVPLTTTHYLAIDDVAREIADGGHVGKYETLVVTSTRAKDYLDLAREALAPDADVFSVGPASTRALVERGFAVTGEATSRARDLAARITRGPVLLLGASQMRSELADDLNDRGLDVVHVACYETRPVAPRDDEIALLRSADVVFVGAPSAWSVAAAFVGPQTWVVVPGATTGDAVRRDHERVVEGWGPLIGGVLSSLTL